MKSILTILMIILLGACKEVPNLQKCITGQEKCKEAPPSANTDDGPIEEEVVPTPEPFTQPPVVEEETKPYYYNHSLYLKAFTFWGLNFVSEDRINGNKQNVFTSTNTVQTTVDTQFKTVYAKIFFEDGEKLKINYYNSSTHALELDYERDWVINDDLKFNIDGYKQGNFADWHSRVYATLKTQNEVDDGVEMYLRTDTVSLGVKCMLNILFQEICTEKFLSTDIYAHYFFD